MPIFCRYIKKRRYFIDISKKADILLFQKNDILTMDIDISPNKDMKKYQICRKNDSFTQNVLIDINININIFENVLIDIDIFKTYLIDIDISKIVFINIDIHIFQNGLIYIDIDIFIIVLIDIDIFQKCRYIDNRYFILIYRTRLHAPHSSSN